MPNQYLKYLIVIVSVVSVLSLNAEPNVLTNVEMINRVAGHIAEQASRQFSVKAGDTLYVDVIKSDDPLNDQFTEYVLMDLINQGCIIMQDDTLSYPQKLKILPPVRIGVDYIKSFRKKRFGGRLIHRKAYAEIGMRYSESSNQPLVAAIFSHAIQDTISAKSRMYAEQGGLIGNVLTENQKHLTWLEPLAAVLITGFVTYLFYIIRSE